MNLDITIHKGDPSKPVVIFIHGLGVDKGFWTDPVNTKVLGGGVPMNVFGARKPRPSTARKTRVITVGTLPGKTENLWHAVTNSHFNALCWSQTRPVGPIRIAVKELNEVVVKMQKLFPGRPIAFIGHSRGGIIARKYMDEKKHRVQGLITIASPHRGSSLSKIGTYLSPLAPALKKVLPQHTHGTASEIISRVIDLLDGKALKELLPGSDFLKNLNDVPHDDINYLSFGGTRATVLTLYRWKKQGAKTCPVPFMTIPDSLVNLLPSRIIPEEIVTPKGDFMVTAKSAVLPWAKAHYNVAANHIAISWNKKVIEKTLELLEAISS